MVLEPNFKPNKFFESFRKSLKVLGFFCCCCCFGFFSHKFYTILSSLCLHALYWMWMLLSRRLVLGLNPMTGTQLLSAPGLGSSPHSFPCAVASSFEKAPPFHLSLLLTTGAELVYFIANSGKTILFFWLVEQGLASSGCKWIPLAVNCC